MGTLAFHLVPEWLVGPNTIIVYTLVVLLLFPIVIALIKRINFIKRVNIISGMPGGISVIGNVFTFLDPPEGKA